MRYTVVWSPEALDKLAELWMQSEDRDAVSRAASLIEGSLRNDPDELGDEFYGDRLLVESPLAVGFRVIKEDRIADIFDVWSQ
jgi:plasmid stabilization system protein ParE